MTWKVYNNDIGKDMKQNFDYKNYTLKKSILKYERGDRYE